MQASQFIREQPEKQIKRYPGSLHSAPTAVDLFAGAGGMTLGLVRAGYQVLYANEINASPAATYKRNFPKIHLEHGDVRSIDPRALYEELGKPAIDLLVAGPPCQGFSTAGRRDASDPRNLLYREVLKFAKEFRPKILVVENVVGMLGKRNGEIVQAMMQEIRDADYYPSCRILKASHFGVPQRRKRVFIISPSKPVPEGELFPRHQQKHVTASAAISDLAFLGVNSSSSAYRRAARSSYQKDMRGEGTILYNHESADHSSVIQERFGSIKQGSTLPPSKDTKKQTHYRLHRRRIVNTLTSIPDDSIHYRLSRALTVREMARLQSFPDQFQFMGPRTSGGERRKVECPQFTQVANAVPPLMAEAVFKNLIVVLNRHWAND